MKKKQTWLVLPTGRTKRTETPSKNNEMEITSSIYEMANIVSGGDRICCENESSLANLKFLSPKET